MHIYQYADGQNIDEMAYHLIERTSDLLSNSGLSSYIAIGFDVQEVELAILFNDRSDIDHMLSITQLAPRSPISVKARELYENYKMPRTNLINFQSEEIDQLLSLLGAFNDEGALA